MSDSSPRRDTWKKFRGNRNAVLGSIIVLFVVLVGHRPVENSYWVPTSWAGTFSAD